MNDDTRDSKHWQDPYLAQVVRIHLVMTGSAVGEEAVAGEPTWPARLIHAGVLLVGVGALLLTSWLRRHL